MRLLGWPDRSSLASCRPVLHGACRCKKGSAIDEHNDVRKLPQAAIDNGDHIEVQPTPATRLLSGLVGGALVILGLMIMVVGPGDLAEATAARFAIGAALTLAGALTLLVRTRRLRIDSAGIAERGALRSRALEWSEIRELAIEEHLEHTGSRLGGLSRRIGFLTVSTGPGRRRGRTAGVTRTEHIVRLHARGPETELTIDLDGADRDEGQILIEELRDRAWLPDDVRTSERA